MTEPLIYECYEDNSGRARNASEHVLSKLSIALGAERLPDTDVHPERKAYLPAAEGETLRRSGLAVQLYAIRREGDWGIGDFTALGDLLEWGRQQGLSYIGINPLHALRLAHPGDCSPYYPSSRLALNPLYIDVDTLCDDLDCTYALSSDTKAELKAAQTATLVDYKGVARAKLEALRSIFGDQASAVDLAGFEEAAGPAIIAHATFDAYEEAEGHPPKFLFSSDEAGLFRRRNKDLYLFHLFLQWAADRQLRAASKRGNGACTLYLDLAVGAAPGGSEVWSQPSAYVPSVRLGAPPDMMAPKGQDWGLVPLHPVALAKKKGEGFRRILDASARYAGALRIDHALGLNRQFFIPRNMAASEATYVKFPQDTMIASVVETSHAHACVMIGEDLGTVPEGLTEALHEANILSYEVTRWARDDEGGAFLTEAEYPGLCLAAATTHDVAPIAGWLSEADLRARLSAGQIENAEIEEERKARREERNGLFELWGLDPSDATDPDRVVTAAHGFLARSNAAIAMMALEDLLLQEEMMNLPGTKDEHPNWRRRYEASNEEWMQDAAVLARLKPGTR